MTFDVSLSNKSYEIYNIDPAVLHQVDEALYPYDTTWKRVGVNVSGGADSAVGTSILCELIEKHGNNTEVVFLTNVRVWNNRPWAAPISIEVYEKIKSMFPDVKMQRVQNFIPPEIEDGVIGIIEQINTSGDRICTQSFNRFAAYTYNLDAVYTFITNNPVVDSVPHHKGPADRRWDEEKVIEEGVCPQFNPADSDRDPIIVAPWKLISKEFIMGQYYRRGWEELLETTRSCEGDKVLFPDDFESYLTYQHGVSPLIECHQLTDDINKQCYWCAERQWAKKEAKRILNAT